MDCRDIHVGDALIVRDWDDMVREFGSQYDSYWDRDDTHQNNVIPCKCTFVWPMKVACGMEVVVTRVEGEFVSLHSLGEDPDNIIKNYNWSADMLRPCDEIPYDPPTESAFTSAVMNF